MLDSLKPCKNCGAAEFKITVTRVDEITVDADGFVQDRTGADSFSRISCTSCASVALEPDALTEDQTAEIYWEIERPVLEG